MPGRARAGAYLDVHQHLWPEPFVEALRRRSSAPMLRGWTLHLTGEPAFEVRPDDHDRGQRRRRERGAERVLVSLSSPLGIEHLSPQQAAPLLNAWHDGAAQLGRPFAAWASVNHVEPDLPGLRALLCGGLCGLQVPATELATPRAVELLAPVLRVCEQLGRPVLVHPGATVTAPAAAIQAAGTGPATAIPPWWPAVVDYPAQLQAAWWSCHEAGRALLPELRICFAAGAGLAPVHHERFAARSGRRFVVDRNTFVETSSYGRQGIDALTRALGIDVIVLGSDRPYAEPFSDQADSWLGAAARHAIEVANPNRLLKGDQS